MLGGSGSGDGCSLGEGGSSVLVEGEVGSEVGGEVGSVEVVPLVVVGGNGGATLGENTTTSQICDSSPLQTGLFGAIFEKTRWSLAISPTQRQVLEQFRGATGGSSLVASSTTAAQSSLLPGIPPDREHFLRISRACSSLMA
ncbi:hypothetical protein [Kribbella amoyensis]|uniref:hypothetical protein n=1 Tax=Kribbella amoyensis TaxID=996641 RepID=UPI001478D7B4|nr:hypothetical protein [Kribbella amoyensis]